MTALCAGSDALSMKNEMKRMTGGGSAERAVVNSGYGGCWTGIRDAGSAKAPPLAGTASSMPSDEPLVATTTPGHIAKKVPKWSNWTRK